MFTRLLPGLRKMAPSRVTAIKTASSLSASFMAIGFLAFTKVTAAPLVNMGVITMKMISRTSMTSTMGVTLMSEVTCGAFGGFIITLLVTCHAGIRQQDDSLACAAPR